MDLNRLSDLFHDRSCLVGECDGKKAHRDSHVKQIARLDQEIDILERRILELEKKIEDGVKK